MPSPLNGDPASRPSRRLAAIAFADVVGYSILMARTRPHPPALDGRSRRHHPPRAETCGRMVKSIGDGVLVGFPSALAAVEWARGPTRVPPPERRLADRLVLRIALHVGDITATNSTCSAMVLISPPACRTMPRPAAPLSEAVDDGPRQHRRSGSRPRVWTQKYPKSRCGPMRSIPSPGH